MKKRGRLIWHTILALSITAILFQIPVVLLNSPTFQKWFLKTYRPFSPWAVEMQTLQVHPLRLKVEIDGLQLTHPGGHQIQLKSIVAKVRPIKSLLRGKLYVEPFDIQSPTITLTKSPKRKGPKKQFKLRTVLLLQNIILNKSHLYNVTMNLPGEKQLTVRKLVITLHSSLLKRSRFKMTFHDVTLADAAGKKSGAERFRIRVYTNLNHWTKTLPYIDNLDGIVSTQKMVLGNLKIDKGKAQMGFRQPRLTLKSLNVWSGEKQITGKFDSHLMNQTYALEVDIPEPMTLPELGGENRTFNMAGQLKGNIRLEGKGFNIKKGSGKGTLAATHIFAGAPEYPAEVNAQFHWENGILQLAQAAINTEEATIDAAGTIDLKTPALHLNLKTKDFPIERLFEKFTDKNLHPIFGKGTVEAQLNGLGKTIHLELNGEVVEGGYAFLHAEKAVIALDITYQGLKLQGELFSAGGLPAASASGSTGKVDMEIKYGPKTPGLPRPKTIALDAKFTKHPLEPMLSGYHLTGLLDGELKLTGPAKNFNGEGHITATDGNLLGTSYDALDARFHLTPKQLKIHQAALNLEEVQTRFTGPLTMDFGPGGFKLYGQPLAGLDLQAAYQGVNKLWQIQKLQIKDPSDPKVSAQVSGSFSPTALNLKGEGIVDLGKIKWIVPQIREAEGPAQFNMNAGGSLANPSLNGKIGFQENTLSIRNVPFSAEELTGTLEFAGNKISTRDLQGLLGVGAFQLQGSLTHAARQAAAYDLHLVGNELYYRNAPGFFRMEYDADVTLKGPATGPMLSGSLNILEAHYTKDFNIIEEIRQSQQPTREMQEAAFEGSPLHLDLKIRSFGDIGIENNVGQIALSANVDIGGTQVNPKIRGTIDVTEGIIRYLALDLDITRGFMEFRDPFKHPYIEIHAERDVEENHIVALLKGHTNKLTIDFTGNTARGVPLQKKDVLSLAFFKQTAEQRGQQAAYFGPALVAEQLTHALQRPIARATKLDVFRLEAAPTQEGRMQKFYLGKKISDRLIVEFISELHREAATQSFQFEYWLTDYLILKGLRTSREKEGYQFNLGLRFTGR